MPTLKIGYDNEERRWTLEVDGHDVAGIARDISIYGSGRDRPEAEILLDVVEIRTFGTDEVKWLGLDNIPTSVLEEIIARRNNENG